MSGPAPIYPGGAFEGADDSAAVVGQITVSPLGLRFETEAFTWDLPLAGLRTSIEDGGQRILFSHPSFPNWTVYSLDPAILDEKDLHRHAKKKGRAPETEAEAAARHAKIVYFSLGGILAVLFGLWAFKHIILSIIVAAMPASWETQIGDAAYEEMRAEYEPLTDPAYTNRLFLVTQRLKKGLPSDAPKFEYMIADDDEVNAMALPGGRVIVMRGLIDQATPDELAGVLSHEIAHVTEKHGMQQLAQVIGPILVVDYVMNSEGALAALIAVATSLSTLEYSRANETEADEKGFEIMVQANIDPRSLSSFFEKLKKIDPRGDSDFFSTHPATSARIKRLAELWEQSPKKSGFARVNGGPDPKPASQ